VFSALETFVIIALYKSIFTIHYHTIWNWFRVQSWGQWCTGRGVHVRRGECPILVVYQRPIGVKIRAERARALMRPGEIRCRQQERRGSQQTRRSGPRIRSSTCHRDAPSQNVIYPAIANTARIYTVTTLRYSDLRL